MKKFTVKNHNAMTSAARRAEAASSCPAFARPCANAATGMHLTALLDTILMVSIFVTLVLVCLILVSLLGLSLISITLIHLLVLVVLAHKCISAKEQPQPK